MDSWEIEISDEDFKLDQLQIDDLSMFSTDDEAKVCQTRYTKPKIFKGIKQVKYSTAEKLARDIAADVFDSKRIFCIISGSFIFGDIIEALMDESRDEHIEELTISTLSLSLENIASLENVIAMRAVTKINLVISDYFYAHNRSIIDFMHEVLDVNDNFSLAVAGTHTKIVLMRMKSGQKITMHGSANLRSSASMEQFMIESDEELYDFNYDWHSMVIKEYDTINKSIRGKYLEQTIGV